MPVTVLDAAGLIRQEAQNLASVAGLSVAVSSETLIRAFHLFMVTN